MSQKSRLKILAGKFCRAIQWFLQETRGEVPKYFASKRRQKLAIGKLEDFNSFSQTGFSVLESRLQSDVPEPAFNGRNGLVVVVFKITNYAR